MPFCWRSQPSSGFAGVYLNISTTKVSRRDLRLVSGLVMLVYVASHLANHALGLVSLGVAEAALAGAARFWRNPIMTVLLYQAAEEPSNQRRSPTLRLGFSKSPEIINLLSDLESSQETPGTISGQTHPVASNPGMRIRL
jgi:hypothetical protein